MNPNFTLLILTLICFSNQVLGQCPPVLAPYTESFDTPSTLPTCWTMSGPENWEFNTAPGWGVTGTLDHTGNGGVYAWVDGSGTGTNTGITLESPEVDVSGLTQPSLDFFMVSNNTNTAGDNNTLTVDIWDGAAWNQVFMIAQDLGPDWFRVNILLNSLTITGPIKARFVVDETAITAFQNDILIDDVSFIEGPDCNSPTFLTINTVGPISAEVGWTTGGDAASTTIEYGPPGFTPGTGTTINTTDTFTIITGLTPSTTYEVYIIENCNMGGTSLPLGPLSLTTTVTCPPPIGVNIVSAQSNQVTIGWTNGGNGITGTFEYGPIGFAPGSGTILTGLTSPTTIMGLNPQTSYTVYVSEDCGPDGVSSLVPINFTTACVTFPSPFLESFDGNATPSCWEEFGNQAWNYSTTAAYGATPAGDHTGNGGNYAWMDGSFNSNGEVSSLTTPLVDVSGLTNPNLAFYFFSNNIDNPGDNNTLTVEIWDGAAWNLGLTLAQDDPDWLLFLIDLTAYTITGPVQARFTVTATAGTTFFNDILIDDVSFIVGPDCNGPSGLVLNSVGPYSAEVGWIPGGAAASTNVEYGPPGFTIGTGTVINVTDTFALIPGLSPLTTYEVYIIENCNMGGTSLLIGPLTVSTTPTCPAPTNFTATNIQPDQVTISWTNGGNGLSGIIEYGPQGFTPGGGAGTVITGATDPTVIMGLSPQTLYSVYLTEDCGPTDGQSIQIGPVNFQTACLPFTAPHFESFDNPSTPQCWEEAGDQAWIYSTGAGGGAITAGDHTGNFGTYAWMDGSFNSNGEISSLSTALVDVSGLTTPALDFWFFSNNTSNPGDNNTMTVEIWDGANWNVASTLAQDDPNWVQIIINLSNYTITGPVRARFTVEATATTAFFNDILIDDVRFDELPVCPNPNNFAISSLTSGMAEVSWSSNAVTVLSTVLEYGPVGFTPGSGTVLTGVTSPASIMGLNPNTSYDVYLREYCTAIDSTDLLGPLSFATLCVPFGAPFTESFDIANQLPNCWTMNGPEPWLFDTTTPNYGASNIPDHTGNGGVYANVDGSGSGTAMGISLVSPEIDISSLTTPSVSFFIFSNNIDNPGDNNTLTVDVWDGATWNTTAVISQDFGPNWTELVYDISSYTYTGPAQVRFTVDETANTAFFNDILIDDVRVDELPLCLSPQAINVSFVDMTSAIINWISPNPSSTASIEYGLSGFSQGGGTYLGTTAGQTSETINGLSPNTLYDFYLTDVCASGDSSFTFGPYQILTICGTNTPGNTPANYIDIGVGPNTFGGSTDCNTDWYNVSSDSTNINGQPSSDIVLRFQTSSCATEISIDLCGSNFDTYLHLLDVNLLHLASNDNDFSFCSQGTNSSIQNFAVTPNSRYYIVIEGAGLSSGVYSLNMTEVENPVSMTNSQVVDANCPNDPSGSIDISLSGGTAPYSYIWSNGATTEDITGVVGGVYDVTITDFPGCQLFESITVNPIGELANVDTSVNVTCFGGSDGEIALSTVLGTAPYTFAWSNGASTEDITNLASGTYTATVTDNLGCSEVVGPIEITEPGEIILAVVSDNTAGTATATPTGGIAPFTYLWSDGQTTETATGLLSGTYEVTVTDAGGCTVVGSTLLLTTLVDVSSVLNSIELYPNPARHEVTLAIELNAETDVRVELINVLGKVLIVNEVDGVKSHRFNFDLNAFPAGSYMLRIIAENEIQTKTLILSE